MDSEVEEDATVPGEKKKARAQDGLGKEPRGSKVNPFTYFLNTKLFHLN
jgi:hypothetical protein